MNSSYQVDKQETITNKIENIKKDLSIQAKFELAKDIFNDIQNKCIVINDASSEGLIKKQNYLHIKTTFDLCEQIHDKNKARIFDAELNKLIDLFYDEISREYGYLILDNFNKKVSSRE